MMGLVEVGGVGGSWFWLAAVGVLMTTALVGHFNSMALSWGATATASRRVVRGYRLSRSSPSSRASTCCQPAVCCECAKRESTRREKIPSLDALTTARRACTCTSTHTEGPATPRPAPYLLHQPRASVLVQAPQTRHDAQVLPANCSRPAPHPPPTPPPPIRPHDGDALT